MKRSEIAAARAKVAIAESRGEPVADWIRELAATPMTDADKSVPSHAAETIGAVDLLTAISEASAAAERDREVARPGRKYRNRSSVAGRWVKQPLSKAQRSIQVSSVDKKRLSGGQSRALRSELYSRLGPWTSLVVLIPGTEFEEAVTAVLRADEISETDGPRDEASAGRYWDPSIERP